jgi:hypothetical protein
LANLRWAFDAVGRHADDLDAGLAEVGSEAGEILGFRCAARGVVLGIEIQHNRIALELGQLELAAIVRRQLELRGLVSVLDHGEPFLCGAVFGHATPPRTRKQNLRAAAMMGWAVTPSDDISPAVIWIG